MDRNHQIDAASLTFESFSFRASLDTTEEDQSFIQMDPLLPPSKRFTERTMSGSQGFEFDFHVSQSPESDLADEIFDKGFILPRSLELSMAKTEEHPTSKPQLAKVEEHSSSKSSELHLPPPFTPKSKRGSKPIAFCLGGRPIKARAFFYKYMNILRPLQWVMGLGGSKKCRSTKSTVHPQLDPSSTTSCSAVSFSENLVHEAILHCKRSSMSNS